MRMCQGLVDKVSRSRQLLAITDPELLSLFEDWFEELEEKVNSFVLYLIFGQGRFRRRWVSEFGNGSRGHSETSLEIVKRRYAKGEISKEELEEIRRELLT